MVFGQISSFSLRSNYDLIGFAPIWLRFGGFWTNPTKIKWFLAKIRWVLLKSDKGLRLFFPDPVGFAQSGKDPMKKCRSSSIGTSGNIFVSFNRPYCRSTESDLTWFVGLLDWQWVFFPATLCHQVSYRLGTNPTWIDLWTSLTTLRNFPKWPPVYISYH